MRGHNRVETAEDGILFMVCVKLSREANAHGSDNLVDLAGYVDLLNYAREQVKGGPIRNHGIAIVGDDAPEIYEVPTNGARCVGNIPPADSVLKEMLKNAVHTSLQKDSR